LDIRQAPVDRDPVVWSIQIELGVLRSGMGSNMNTRNAFAFLVIVVVLAQACSATPPEPVGASSSALSFASMWVPIGPDAITLGEGSIGRQNVTGRISVIAANPQNPTGDIWVGGGSGGLWRGTNNPALFFPHTQYQLQLTWQPMLDSLSPLAIGAIKLTGCTSTQCSTVWVGTGENSIRRDTYYGSGVAVGRWNGSGYTFTTGLGGSYFANGSITGLAVDPITSYPNETLYVALSSGEFTNAADATVLTSPAGSYGVYKSTDSGTTWTLVLTRTGVKATDLEMDPTNPQVLYAAMQSAGFFKSINGGLTWTAMNAGIDPTLLTGSATPADWAELAIAPSTPSTLYAAIGYCPNGFQDTGTGWCKPGIYESMDGGAQWQLQSAFVPASDPSLASADSYYDPLSAYSTYHHKLIVHPTDPTQVWFLGTQLSYSNGLGCSSGSGCSGSWTTVGDLHFDHHDLFLFRNNGSLEALDANDGGFFVGDGQFTWDDGSQWGLQVTQLQSLTIVPGSPGTLLQGTQDNGTNVLVSTSVWQHVDDGDSASAFVDVDRPWIAYDDYTKTDSQTPRRCTNNLSCNFNWSTGFDGQVVNGGINTSDPSAYYPPMQQSAGGLLPFQQFHSLFIASNKLYASSTDQLNPSALSWVPVGSLTPAEHTIFYPDINSTNVITAIGIAPTNAQRGYVGFYNGEVWTFQGAYGSATWTQVLTGGTTPNPVSAILVDSAIDTNVWVAYSGAASGSIVTSSNAGASWTDISAGLPPVHVNSLSILTAGQGFVLAGTDNGIFSRGFAEKTMHPLAAGLPAVPVFALAVDNDQGKIFAGTHGRGVWALSFQNKPFLQPHAFWCETCNFFGPGPLQGPDDLTLYGQMFPPNESCGVTLFQQAPQSPQSQQGEDDDRGLVKCAKGSTDGDGASIHTDAQGMLVTDKIGSYANKPLAWLCLAGRCVGDTGQSQCTSAPVVRARIKCGNRTGTVTIAPPSARANPASALFTITPDMNANDPAYTLTLNARIRSASGATQTLCSVSRTLSPGADAPRILSALASAVSSDPTCQAAGVSANVVPASGASGGEEQLVVTPVLGLSAPSVVGRQLFPEITGTTRGVLEVDGMGRIVEEQSDPPMVTLAVPNGAAGGSVTITEITSLGQCSYVVPTVRGDSAASITAKAAALFNSSSNDGNCRDAQKPRDLVVRNGGNVTSNAIFAAANQVRVQSTDANVTITVGPAGW
jgi:hypothetical protein